MIDHENQLNCSVSGKKISACSKAHLYEPDCVLQFCSSVVSSVAVNGRIEVFVQLSRVILSYIQKNAITHLYARWVRLGLIKYGNQKAL